MSNAKQLYVKESVVALKKLLSKGYKVQYFIKILWSQFWFQVENSPYSPELNPAEKMWARLKRAFTNKLFKSLEEISSFIDNAANEINKDIVISTCAYKYISFDPFKNEI